MPTSKRDVSCMRCFVMVAPYALQVVTMAGSYHLDCYESLYLRQYGERPPLVPGPQHERHVYRTVDRAA